MFMERPCHPGLSLEQPGGKHHDIGTTVRRQEPISDCSYQNWKSGDSAGASSEAISKLTGEDVKRFARGKPEFIFGREDIDLCTPNSSSMTI